ncbi:MAG: phosphoribosylanthranilate isomerase [Candidatus Methylarchaceae archaeon HK01B]|nr:phosphoribosylanthranilate isomerase [Candidatus Methylarchaceae archaeon HK01M]MCP8312158.1 phosphoribosylanthranilate isomerase [Candidatus Methylarchaceae archaeon HK02M1]MCP8318401.1 phosphoribosylanthranilate isomerase [Candidatus Methylarchaceae archaeon HK01B]
MVRVKVCGITNERDLEDAVSAGTDAVGFIVDVRSSPRSISIDRARELMKKVPIFVSRIAVTVLEDLDRLITIENELKPEYIQIHGNRGHSREVLNNARLIKAIALKSTRSMKDILDNLEDFDAILIDSYIEGKHGGTGIVNDFEICKKVRETIYPKPLILAGGLNPDNVEEAVRIVKPFAVDVCSGVESSPGIKDRKKLFDFVGNAKRVIV